MKRSVKVIATILCISFLWLTLCGGCAPYRFKGGSIDGVALKGKTAADVEKILREKYLTELKAKRLKINVDGKIYTFCYPEINYSSDLNKVLRTVKEKPDNYRVSRRYYLCQKEKTLGGICENYSCRAVSARAEFTGKYGEPFKFYESTPARYIDYEKLLNDVENSLKTDFATVYAKTEQKHAGARLEEIKKEHTLLSEFTTYFSADNAPRVHNIALAAAKINGTVLNLEEEFSFNAVVGERTQKNGFKNAPVIFEGDFVEGVGGGVCQVSTTLYNVALLAGLEICEHHAHSLKVGYVEPSFDAMVSGNTADLKFKNVTGGNIYILAKTTKSSVSVALYGQQSEITYSRKSVIIEEILPPQAEEVEGDEEKILKQEKKGLISEGYLVAFKGGKQVSVKKIRKDKYAAVRGIVQRAKSALQ